MEMKENKVQLYEAPSCMLLRVEMENLICKTSVEMNSQTSTEEEWNPDEEVNGGELEL
jgi:hypothetical protein